LRRMGGLEEPEKKDDPARFRARSSVTGEIMCCLKALTKT
jgi:hypothetical protein